MSIEVTSAGGTRPVVVLRGALTGFSDRLARAGFRVVTFAPEGGPALSVVLAALARGALGAPAPGLTLVERHADGAIVVTRVPDGGAASFLSAPSLPPASLTVPAEPASDALGAVMRWLTQHIA